MSVTEKEISSGRRDLESLRFLRTLKTSELEMGPTGINSEDNREGGGNPWKIIVYSLKILAASVV
jgi:hypothetical protein